ADYHDVAHRASLHPRGTIPSVQLVPASGSPAALACTPFPCGSSPPMIQAIRLMGWLVTAHAISHGRAASCAVCWGACHPPFHTNRTPTAGENSVLGSA